MPYRPFAHSVDLCSSRILVVDDEPANLKLLDKLLRSQGYQNLVLVSDPRKVTEHYATSPVDLILLDINMPYMDGYAVMTQLKALNDPLLPPIVILSAQIDSVHLLQALQMGARDYIAKPFDRNELLMRVRNLLEAHLAHRMLDDHKNTLQALVQAQTEEIRRSRLQMVQRLGKAAEYRDEETGMHIMRMSHICAEIAAELGWDAAACELLLNASPMHDIGKIGIPDAILQKPGKLDADEWRIMQTHVEIGAQLLSGDDSELMVMAHDIALGHHERWDGLGYPQGLRGTAIPQAARIATLSDVFDALTSERPYKQPWSVDAAVAWIQEHCGTQFDPEVVGAFLVVLPKVEAIREHYADVIRD